MASALKIAVLDDYQGISKPHFEKLDSTEYEVEYFPDTLLPYSHPATPDAVKDELVKRLEPFDIICGMRERTPFPGALLERLPNLKLLLNTGTRNRSLDLEACKSRAIPVAGAADVGHDPASPDSTTQHCVAMILALTKNIAQDDANMKAGKWQTGVSMGLGGKTLGCVGLGRLGTAVARIMAVAFGMRIIAWSENLTQEKASAQATSVGLGEESFKAVSKEELFRTADVVSVHVVLSDRTRGLIAKKDLELMKPTSFLVNTSRGPIIAEEHLVNACRDGKIRGVGLDVFELEPLPLESSWRSNEWGKEGRSQVLLTPHMAYVEERSMNGFYQEQLANILRWKRGEELTTRLA